MKLFPEISEIFEGPGADLGSGLSFYGLFGAGKALFVKELLENTDKKAVFVAKSELSGAEFYRDMCFLMGRDKVVMPDASEYMIYDAMPSGNSGEHNRIEALIKMFDGDYKVAVITPALLIERLPAGEDLKRATLNIVKGEEYDLPGLSEKLTRMGYTKVPRAEEQGQFAQRGDILDIFPYGAENPARTEFFGDAAESLRYYDPLTQRADEELDAVQILPGRDTVIFERSQLERVKSGMISAAVRSRSPGLRRRVQSDAERMELGGVFKGIDRYIYFILGEGRRIFDYAGDCLRIFEEPEETAEAVRNIYEDHIRICDSVKDTSGLLKETYKIYRDPEEALRETENCKNITIRQFGEQSGGAYNIEQKEITALSDGVSRDEGYILSLAGEGNRVIYYTETDSGARRLSALLEEKGGSVCPADRDPGPGEIKVSKGGLSASVFFPQSRTAIITEAGLSRGGQGKPGRRRRQKGSAVSFSDLSEGDIVVHDIHGIGRYDGIVSITADGARGDYIKISYRDNGVIYVPAHRLSEISKYVGNGSNPPVLNKLGGQEWNKMTEKVRSSLKVYAKELVELYAKRSKQKGFSFSPDTLWQKEFENEFPYEETEDQLKCTSEIKADMEMPRPMDRLLCGDVGYGKTEVALRAAFKAVCDSKQVIFLVPTTVLCLQHFKTFTERFKNYPVKIASLCRMDTETEKKKTIEDVKKGFVDILVGTHSIIKRKIDFKDPGLLIIDEEQRFGVKQKEKIKELYPGIDILTLSATPIPRTLHMSLSGIRDISLIEDPPPNRVPVKTYVAPYDPSMIKNAIYREMGRKGQVFYLFNNVEKLEEKYRELREMIPEARICVGNGQMDEGDLEDVLNDFINYKYDILLCTTIIESGVDMPNVNTLIVENGDRFGLSQLYQIRGRVGRSDKAAYAYITYNGNKELTEQAEKRLRTIRENTDFGAGFKIAMKDLEIRGAGSVLGERQHGQISVVGYEMYCRILSEVVEETVSGIKKTEAGEARSSATVDLKINAYIPEKYIEDEESRLSAYRQISSVGSEEDIEDLTEEFEERYGKVPAETLILMQISFLRYLAETRRVSGIIRKGDRVFIMLSENASAGNINNLGRKASEALPGKTFVGIGKTPYVSLEIKGLSQDSIISVLKCILS